MKMIWHNFLVNYYMYLYNRCSEKEHEERSKLIKLAFAHQDKMLEIKLSKHKIMKKQTIFATLMLKE